MFEIEGRIKGPVVERHGEFLILDGHISIDGEHTPTRIEIHGIKHPAALDRVHALRSGQKVKMIFREA